MNITHVIPYMHPDAGGPPVVVDRLGRQLVARGHCVTVVTTTALAGQIKGWESRYADAGYELIVVPSRTDRPFGYSKELRGVLKQTVSASDIVHLHTVWTYPPLAAGKLCRSSGVPYFVMPHGMLDPHSLQRKRWKKWLFARLVERPNLRRASAMIYTHAEEERLARLSTPDLPRGFVVPLGADDPPEVHRAELADEFHSRHAGLRGKRLVLFLGRLHSKKGLDLLLPAMARLRGEVADAHLLLVGPCDPDYRAKLDGVIQQLAITGAVTLTGALAGREKWGAIAAASVFALPSYQENFALTVVEAMRMGLPVVLSRRVNIWRDLVEARAALPCELDELDVAKQLRAVLEDDALRVTMGEAGLQLSQAVYSWRNSADALELAYRSILDAAGE